MKVLTTAREMNRTVLELREKGKTLGLVPTMGMFHAGHLSLMRRAREENDAVLVSLFVNPTQFGPDEDYESYPREPETDLQLAEREEVALVFQPSVEEIYPPDDRTVVEVQELSNFLCGANRPGHFRGVTTVVAKLLAICGPHRAYFGKKDYQQWVIIRRMVWDLGLGVEIVGCPIIREADGLACSSRNAYLNPEDRARAPGLHLALERIRAGVAAGQTETSVLVRDARNILEDYKLREDYLAIVDPESLQGIDRIRGPAVALGAIWCGKARLIDNVELI